MWFTHNLEVGGSSVDQFQPHQSPQHLERAVRFLAASLARDWKKLAAFCPELAQQIENSATTETWQRAASEYDELWRRRLVNQERGPGWTPATVVFKGAALLLVETVAKERFTFKFDTSLTPQSSDVAVGRIWETPQGGFAARELKIGDAVIRFDEAGAPVAPPTSAVTIPTPRK